MPGYLAHKPIKIVIHAHDHAVLCHQGHSLYGSSCLYHDGGQPGSLQFAFCRYRRTTAHHAPRHVLCSQGISPLVAHAKGGTACIITHVVFSHDQQFSRHTRRHRQLHFRPYGLVVIGIYSHAHRSCRHAVTFFARGMDGNPICIHPYRFHTAIAGGVLAFFNQISQGKIFPTENTHTAFCGQYRGRCKIWIFLYRHNLGQVQRTQGKRNLHHTRLVSVEITAPHRQTFRLIHRNLKFLQRCADLTVVQHDLHTFTTHKCSTALRKHQLLYRLRAQSQTLHAFFLLNGRIIRQPHAHRTHTCSTEDQLVPDYFRHVLVARRGLPLAKGRTGRFRIEDHTHHVVAIGFLPIHTHESQTKPGNTALVYVCIRSHLVD